MVLRLLVLVVGLFGFLSVAAADRAAQPPRTSAPEDPDGLGGRPVDSIHDPLGLLPEKARRELADELAAIRAAGGLDVMVVLLGRGGEDEPEDLALELANRWGDASGRAVILHVEGWAGSPWVAISGRIVEEIPAKVLDGIRLKAEKRARSSDGLDNQIRDAVAVLTDEVRFLRATLRGGRIIEVEKEAPHSLRRTIYDTARRMPWMVAGLLLLIGLLIGVWKLLRAAGRSLRMVRPLEFPMLECKRRFGAPYGAEVHSAHSSFAVAEPVPSVRSPQTNDP